MVDQGGVDNTGFEPPLVGRHLVVLEPPPILRFNIQVSQPETYNPGHPLRRPISSEKQLPQLRRESLTGSACIPSFAVTFKHLPGSPQRPLVVADRSINPIHKICTVVRLKWAVGGTPNQMPELLELDNWLPKTQMTC